MSTSVISAVGQSTLEVRDIDRAVAFYRDKLGLTYLFSAPPGLAFFDCAGLRLLLTTPEKDVSRKLSNSTIYFTVSDIHASHQAFLAKGIPFEDEPHLIARLENHELWMTFFRDPDGNLLSLMCEVLLSEKVS